MTTKTMKPKNILKTAVVRRAYIPADLGYMTASEFGKTMVTLAEEIALEQGKRSPEEIERLIELMRGSASFNADLPR